MRGQSSTGGSRMKLKWKEEDGAFISTRVSNIESDEIKGDVVFSPLSSETHGLTFFSPR